LAKAAVLETYIKEMLISDLWPNTILLMTFGFCFIVLGQIPGHHLKPHNCIINEVLLTFSPVIYILRHWQRCWLNQRKNHSVIY